MTIQWFPGHMHRTRKQIAATMPKIDLALELLDARIPSASTNPLIEELIGSKPCIKVLNKADIADAKVTQQWLDNFSNQGQLAIAISAHQSASVQKLTNICQKTLIHRKLAKKRSRVVILGIPNAGKSSLINAFLGRKVVQAGNLPALTRHAQSVKISHDLELFDTPGILWPKLSCQHAAQRLAMVAAIRDTALDLLEIGLAAIAFLKIRYPQRLHQRYQLQTAGMLHQEPEDLLRAISSHAGCFAQGGEFDLQRAAQMLLSDLRQGRLGRISLEDPVSIQQEKARSYEHDTTFEMPLT